MKRKTGPWIVLVMFVTFFFSRPAHAYLDPGTGSFVFQTVLGLLFGAAYAVKVYWRQIRLLFRRPPPAKDAVEKSQGGLGNGVENIAKSR